MLRSFRETCAGFPVNATSNFVHPPWAVIQRERRGLPVDPVPGPVVGVGKRVLGPDTVAVVVHAGKQHEIARQWVQPGGPVSAVAIIDATPPEHVAHTLRRRGGPPAARASKDPGPAPGREPASRWPLSRRGAVPRPRTRAIRLGRPEQPGRAGLHLADAREDAATSARGPSRTRYHRLTSSRGGVPCPNRPCPPRSRRSPLTASPRSRGRSAPCGCRRAGKDRGPRSLRPFSATDGSRSYSTRCSRADPI